MAIANTTIRIKKSVLTGNTPSSLANGELAINSADGKLFYATPTGAISFLTNQQSFATINANSSLVLATSPTDTLTLLPGNNISIVANTSTKSITISSTSSGASIGSRTVTEFTATSGQTTFSATYVPGYVDVLRNGIQLGSADYTATNGSTVVLGIGANAGDLVTIQSYYTNFISNNTFSAAVTIANTTSSTSTSTGALIVTGGVGVAGNVNAGTFYGAGTGLTGTASSLSIGGNAGTVTNGVYTTGVGVVTNTMLAGSIANSKLSNSAITINGTSTSLGSSISVGTVTSVGGTGTVSGLSLSGTVTGTGNLTLGGTLAVTASNFSSQTANYFLAAPNGSAGVPTFRAIVAADIPTLNQNTTGSAATATTASTANALNTSNNYQVNTIGVGTAADTANTGSIRATGNITAYYSDERLKKKLGYIDNALQKVCNIETFYYEANELAQSLGYKPIREVGVSAQSVQKVAPEIVKPAPIDEQYLTVDYERLTPFLIESIKQLNNQLEEMKAELEKIKGKI